MTVRRARVEERAAVLDIIDSVWRGNADSPGDRGRSHPHLFTDERVGDHFVCEIDGALAGVVDGYPYDVRLGGVTFRMTGIGQVITRPEFRRRGVMTAIMRAIIQSIYDEGLDGSWLMGDRRRYGRFGYADGGRFLRFETRDRYLPDPEAAAGARALDLDLDFPSIRRHVDALPGAVLMSDDELQMVLSAFGARGTVLNGSFIVTDRRGRRVLFADGEPEEIALLIARQHCALREEEDGASLIIDAPCDDAPLARACRRLHWRAAQHHSCSFRVGALMPFLDRAVRVAAPRVSAGSDRLEVVNTDTGEAATIAAAGGRIRVSEGAGAGAVRLDTLALSELFFSMLPPERHLPDLSPAGPLRALFPLDVHLPFFFAVVV